MNFLPFSLGSSQATSHENKTALTDSGRRGKVRGNREITDSNLVGVWEKKSENQKAKKINFLNLSFFHGFLLSLPPFCKAHSQAGKGGFGQSDRKNTP